MKPTFFIPLTLAFLIGVIGAISESAILPESTPPPSVTLLYEPIAVVELFTSQGCSSCPPADQLLGSIVNEAETQDQSVYALSFHVAYWNYLGWQDPFSHEAFTKRQRQYARTLGESVYTPQMVVNGTKVFVGSKSSMAQDEIQKAQQQAATHRIMMVPTLDEKEVYIKFKVEGPASGQVLHLALVERDLSVDVKRGENSGRTLHHDNVVRQFETVSLETQSGGSLRIKLPEGINLSKTSLIGYVQDTQSLEISGASRAALSSQR